MAAESLYHPDLNLPYPEVDKEAVQECSVRGCRRPIELNGQNKMCDECRSRHRGYATTKRLRRKLEKAALQAMGVSGETPIVPMDIEEWDPTIDPILYDVSRPATTTPGPSISLSSSTSELANALTYYDQDHLTQFQENAPALEATTCISPAMLQGGSTEPTPVPMAEEDEDVSPARFCSVKGCKAVIPGSYEYKMCPLCRTRYRGYGITKRAKWKNEREVFEKEMTHLRAAEDERRTANGEPSLAEDPVALKKWEMMILDEEIPLPPPVLAALKAAGVNADGTLEPGSNALSLYQNDPGQPSEIDTPHAIVPYPSVLGSIPQLPARMCTVSHCHQILPGYYRYKRCEQHRLQNRHHSKLKRVREKVEKAIGPMEGAPVLDIPPEVTEPKRRGKAREQQPESITAEVMLEDSGNEEVPEPEVEARPRKAKGRKATHCITESCGKPLPEDKRWKNCDDCRAEERQKKQRVKAQVRLKKNSLPPEAGPAEAASVEPATVVGTPGDPEAEASSNAVKPQPLKLVNMTADTFESPEPSFRWSDETTAIAVDSSTPLDLSRQSNPRQPLMIRHYRPKDTEKSSSGPSTTQPYVIVEQFPFREFHTVPPHQSSVSFEPGPPSLNAVPATVHKPYPNSGIFRHYVPVEDKGPELPPTDPPSPARNLSLAPTPGLVPAPAPSEEQSGPVPLPAPTATPLTSVSTGKKTTKPKPKSKGKRKDKTAENPIPNTGAAANLVPQLLQYSPYPVHPYFFLPPQYNPNTAPSAYAYPGYPPIVAPPPSGEASAKGPLSEGASGTAASSSSTSATPQGLLTVPYPYTYPHPQAAGIPYAFPLSVSAAPNTGPAGGGAIPFPYFYPSYPYSTSAPPIPGFPPVPFSAPAQTAAVGTSSVGVPGTSVSAPPVNPTPSNNPMSVSALVGSGQAPASRTAAKSSRPTKEPKETRETRFSYYHHGYGTTDSPDTPTVVSDGTKKRRKIDPVWLEKQRLKAGEEAQQPQLEAAPAPTHTNPVAEWVGGEVLANPAATSGTTPAVSIQQTALETSTPMPMDIEPPLQQEDSASTSNPATQLVQHPCSHKTCKRRVTSASGTALCDKCKAKFKKHAEKNKRRHKLVPVKPVSATLVGVDMNPSA